MGKHASAPPTTSVEDEWLEGMAGSEKLMEHSVIGRGDGGIGGKVTTDGGLGSVHPDVRL